jgi:hypothetical protein
MSSSGSSARVARHLDPELKKPMSGSGSSARVARHLGPEQWGAIAYWALAAIPVAVTLFLPALAITDGGLHLASAAAVNGLIDGRWTGLVQWTGTLPPNLLVEALLALLVRIMDAELALRLVACLLLLGFAAGARAFVKAVRAPAIAGVLFLPFEAHYLFQAAQLGFTAGAALALALVALVLRHPAGVPRLKFALLLCATWLAHIFPTMLAMVGVLGIVLARSLQESSGNLFWPRMRQAIVTAVRQLTVASLPALALTVAWVATAPVFVAVVENPPHDLIHAIKNVVGMTWSTVSYSRVELSVYRALALMLYAITGAILVYRFRAQRRGVDGIRAADGLLAAAIVIAFVAIVIPDASTGGAGMLEVRTSLFVPLFLVGWIVANMDAIRLAIADRGKAITRTSLVAPIAVAIAAVLVVTAVRLPRQVALGRQVLDMRALGRCIPEGSTMIQLDLADASRYSQDRYSLVRQTGLIAGDNHLLALDNESGWYPYYPWGFTDPARADRLLQTARNGAANTPPDVVLASAVQTGLPLDAVVLYGRQLADPATLADTRSVQLLQDLPEHFHLAAASKTGDWELWLRPGLVGTCG